MAGAAPGFAHLHVASGFSARYGASHPETLAERAGERGMAALALTDRDTLAGAVRFSRACGRAGVRPVYGVELAVAEPPTDTGAGSAPGGGRPRRRRTPVKGGIFVDESASRVVFLARDGAVGWAGLCRLVTAAHADAEQPLLPWAEARAHGEGLIVLLGPDAEVGRALAAGRPDRAARLLAPWREAFGDALRLEVSASGPTRTAARTLGLAAELGVRPVLSNAVRYADPGQGPVADVLDAARRLAPIDPRRGLDNGERWLKGPDAMAQAALRIAEAAGYGRTVAHRLLTLTEETADACRVDPEDDLGIGRVHFPEPHLVGAGARTADRVLRSRCAAGMIARRLERDETRWRRLEEELRVIERLGFASYFLTVAQVVEDLRGLGIRVAARGSGAGSFVNHLLGIAHADPVEHGLLMERFLSPRRAVLPDIDIDVESARRLEGYRAIFERFGERRVATVAMPETYRVRHAVRDVGLALGLDPAETGRLAKAFPHIRARDARAALAELPELRAIDTEAHGPRMWDLVEALDALPRGVAMHPCGVLLSDASLRARTPVVPTSGEGFAMSQFDKDDVEDLGLLKLDVLGVRMQSAMAHAVAEIERATGEHVDLDAFPLPGSSQGPPSAPAPAGRGPDREPRAASSAVPPRGGPSGPAPVVPGGTLAGPGGEPVASPSASGGATAGAARGGTSRAAAGGGSPHTPRPVAPTVAGKAFVDEETYRLIRSSETLGCFQIESPGQRDLIARLQPRDFHDLVVDISLFRPGPVGADMVRPFIDARNGRRQPRYPHPDLVPALRETYGVVIFHEQVIRILATMTGQDRALADEARRALSDRERQGRVRAWFAAEAEKRGYAPEVIGRTWEIIEAFGSFGFCKAHAVAFAVPTYQSAWLKTHHPAAFYAGLLTHDPGMYPKRLLLADARRRGVPILPLDVNRSDTVYRIELESEFGAWGVRLALGEVHGVSEAEAERIAAGRPYASLPDLLDRAAPSLPIAERLARVGALDSFGDNRRDLLLHLAELHRQRRGSGAGGRQLPFGAPGDAAGDAPDDASEEETGQAGQPGRLPPAGLPDLDADERLGAELGVLGMDASRHLMADHRAFLDELGVVSARRLREAEHGQTVLVAGAKAATQTPPIRSGRRVIFATLDDTTGLVDLAFFDDSHAACAHTVFHSWLLLVRGTVQRRGPRALSVVGQAAWDLAELAGLRETGGLDAVAARLAERPEGDPDAGENGGDEGDADENGADEGGSGTEKSTDRHIEMSTGYTLHPWADLRPAGDSPKSVAEGVRKLWHASPGSAG
ncbi:PHP domain-containing protein [Streptomyces sp. B6B3]|uniref:DNA polymerase III subunit alpha n=1 Tax=Streptomyces sp. B6B3 TaxID=3153570 RepID=UPI00325D4C2D